LRPLSVAAIVLSLLMLGLLIFPLGRMFYALLFGDQQEHIGDALRLFGEPWLVPVFINTAIAVGAGTILAVIIGAALAWINERTEASLGFVGSLLPIIPLLIPNVALAIGWVFIGAPRVGFLNGLLQALHIPVQVNIYSWPGLILIYAIHGVPYVYLVVSAAIRNLDPALEEAARVSGAGLLRTLRTVSGPAVAPALFGSGLLALIIGFGLYSVPAVVATSAGIDMLPTRIVQLLTQDFPPKMGEAQALGALMLVVIIALWLLQRRISRSGQFVTMGGRAAGGAKLELGRWKWPARAFTILFLLATSVLPLLALLIVSLQPYWTPRISLAQLTLKNYQQVLFVDHLTTVAFGNSLTLAIAGGLIGMVIAVIIVIESTLRQGPVTALSDAAITASSAIPHLILALAFLVAFSGAPFYLAGTKTILLLAFIVMYMPPGFIAANAAIAQVGRDLREASQVNGAGEMRTVGRIVLPLSFPGLAAGFAIVFVHMMGDLSAAALLSGLGTPVIGFVIISIWDTGTFGLLAAFSAAMCVVNVAVIVAMLGLGRLLSRR
jgi:iron(III) transport system permease protein